MTSFLKNLLFIISGVLLFDCGFNQTTKPFITGEWQVAGRGEVDWQRNITSLKDCFIAFKDPVKSDSWELKFTAKAIEGTQVQIWSGFSFTNRDNRYALGLRGGINNDIYLCRYAETGNDMLALEPLDFHPQPGEWYRFKVAFSDGNIRVYLNDESRPRIAVKDDQELRRGSIVLGGGWLRTSYKDLEIKEINDAEAAIYLADSVPYAPVISDRDRESRRLAQRRSYSRKVIPELFDNKMEISLNGDWLFMPEDLVTNPEDAVNKEKPDDDWHVMKVPAFWNPVTNWLHLGDSKLPHPGSGVSDNYWQKEIARCEDFTFEYEKVKGAYYRHWLVFPAGIKNRLVRLHFDAVAKVAEVWINGRHVGRHLGMFEDFAMDISSYIDEGENLVVVKVNNEIAEKSADADEVAEVAITVEVTNDMLNSLPRGMFDKDEGGIWQPVKLIISQKTFIDDVFVKTGTDGADIDITLNNQDEGDQSMRLEVEISDIDGGNSFFNFPEKSLVLSAGEVRTITLSTGTVQPRLWSPEYPNLYDLTISLFRGEVLIDQFSREIGFRTFETIGNKFYLNGKPYWLRGANHPPIGLAPNNEKLANSFFRLMHDNNQMVTRTHGAPITETWATAANRQGVGISVEGNWPWVMLGSGMPSRDLLELWKRETLAMVKKYRNDPSILAWTVSNESYFTNYYVKDDQRMEKWRVFSDIIKAIRELDPTRPICPTSGYIRHTPDYENVLKPAGIDDGDFDDSHNSYFGWYNPDQFDLYDGIWTKELYLSTGATADRPFITQELSSGYPNNDSGHPTRKYIFEHYVPQAWVGDWAYEDHDPSFYLERNAFLTKEIGETLRRTSPEGAGILHFANICWFRNVLDAGSIAPYPVVESMKKALAPVLISAELLGRNFYSGSSLNPRVCIVNDLENGERLPAGELRWEVTNQGDQLTSGKVKTDEVPHYGRVWRRVPIELPDVLPGPKINCELRFSLWMNGELIAENDYEVLLCRPDWVVAGLNAAKKISLYDPAGATKRVLGQLRVQSSEIRNLGSPESDILIVANLDSLEETPDNLENVLSHAKNGGKVLLIHPGKHLQTILPEAVESILEESGRIANMHIPESPVFDDIGPMELSWWQPHREKYPTVCRRSYRLAGSANALQLATFLKVHSYLGDKEKQLKEFGGTPLVQFKVGSGVIISSELELNSGITDPIAARTLTNMVRMLMETGLKETLDDSETK